jgi:hypothetical protein
VASALTSTCSDKGVKTGIDKKERLQNEAVCYPFDPHLHFSLAESKQNVLSFVSTIVRVKHSIL